MIDTPVKQGIRAQAGYTKNTILHNLKEVLQCKTQGFGERPEVYGAGGHNGLDLVYEDSTALYAPFDGFLYRKTETTGYGKYVTIVGGGYKIVLGHLKEFLVPDGEVKRGQHIARGDSTGFSSGPHLHITLKKVDANGNVLNRDNGHDGAIDVEPHLAYLMFQLYQVSGSKDVWLIRDGKRSLVYNAGALLLIGDFADIKQVTQDELETFQDTGKVLASLDQE